MHECNPCDGPSRPEWLPQFQSTIRGSQMHLRTKLMLLGVLATAAIAAVAVGVAQGAGPTTPGAGRGPEAYTIGLFGDMPYNALGKSQYPTLLADVNNANVAFS